MIANKIYWDRSKKRIFKRDNEKIANLSGYNELYTREEKIPGTITPTELCYLSRLFDNTNQ